jgi:hypothetical protein
MPKVDDWRAEVKAWKDILNKPKNLGLKAGGTGASEAMRKVGDAEMDYEKAKTPAAIHDLEKELDELKKVCDATVNKHKKLFTEACTHLAKVSVAATTRKHELRTELEERKRPLIRECDEATKAALRAKTVKDLGDVMEELATKLEAGVKDFPKLQPQIGVLRAFHGQQHANIEFDKARDAASTLIVKTNVQVNVAAVV